MSHELLNLRHEPVQRVGRSGRHVRALAPLLVVVAVMTIGWDWTSVVPSRLVPLVDDGATPAALQIAQTGPSESAPEDSDPGTDEAVSASELSVEEIAQRIQSRYDDVRDFSADFAQEFTNVALGETRRSTGHVWFKKPGMMRWDYATPTERYLISDGEDLWIYEPEFSQYYTQSLESSQLPTALRFLMGEGRLTDDFDVTIDDATTDERVVLQLVPKESAAQYRSLTFVVDPSTWLVRETVVHDPVGNTNRIVFDEAEQNIGLPDEGFGFSPPEGAERVTGPQ